MIPYAAIAPVGVMIPGPSHIPSVNKSRLNQSGSIEEQAMGYAPPSFEPPTDSARYSEESDTSYANIGTGLFGAGILGLGAKKAVDTSQTVKSDYDAFKNAAGSVLHDVNTRTQDAKDDVTRTLADARNQLEIMRYNISQASTKVSIAIYAFIGCLTIYIILDILQLIKKDKTTK